MRPIISCFFSSPTARYALVKSISSGKPYYNYSPATRKDAWESQGVLSGKELRTQVNKWVQYGTIETDAADAIVKCCKQRSEHFSSCSQKVPRYPGSQKHWPWCWIPWPEHADARCSPRDKTAPDMSSARGASCKRHRATYTRRTCILRSNNHGSTRCAVTCSCRNTYCSTGAPQGCR